VQKVWGVGAGWHVVRGVWCPVELVWGNQVCGKVACGGVCGGGVEGKVAREVWKGVCQMAVQWWRAGGGVYSGASEGPSERK